LHGFESVTFVDQGRGWAISRDHRGWGTTDAGATWTLLVPETSGVSNPLNAAYTMAFANESRGWAIEAFAIRRTQDGGATWEEPVNPSGTDDSLGAYFFLSPKVAWVSAGTQRVYRTDDGGLTWDGRRLPFHVHGDITKIFFVNAETGWLCTGLGRGAAVYRTDDGGLSWTREVVPVARVDFSSLSFANQRDGWAVGNKQTGGGDSEDEESEGVVLRTEDGGVSWTRVPVGQGEHSFDEVCFPAQGSGWIVATNNVYRSEDGGNSWRVVLSLPDPPQPAEGNE